MQISHIINNQYEKYVKKNFIQKMPSLLAFQQKTV